MLHFHIYAKANELSILEQQLDKANLLCIKAENVIITEHCIEVMKIVADYVIKYLYKNYVQNNLCNKYSYFNSDERSQIGNQVIFSIENSMLVSRLKKVRFGVNLHSFVRFMMADELVNIDAEIDRACEIMHAKREYYDYIRLLRYYADMHESNYDTLNIVFSDYGFNIFDEKFNPISSAEVNAEFAVMEEDDSLITTLIDLSPKKIVIHGENNANTDVIDTIVNVFGDKVFLCDGCPHCLT